MRALVISSRSLWSASLPPCHRANDQILKIDFERLQHFLEHLFRSLSEKLPAIEHAAYKAIDTVFAPKVIIRQFLIAIALEIGLTSYQLASRAGARAINKLTQKGRQISETHRKLHKAKNYYEWLKSAERLDELEGRNKWRETPDCSMYNYRVVQVRLKSQDPISSCQF